MKPSIENVYTAFHRFMVAMMPSNMPPIRYKSDWEKEAAANREALKAELESLGLAEHIDWDVQK